MTWCSPSMAWCNNFDHFNWCMSITSTIIPSRTFSINKKWKEILKNVPVGLCKTNHIPYDGQPPPPPDQPPLITPADAHAKTASKQMKTYRKKTHSTTSIIKQLNNKLSTMKKNLKKSVRN